MVAEEEDKTADTTAAQTPSSEQNKSAIASEVNSVAGQENTTSTITPDGTTTEPEQQKEETTTGTTIESEQQKTDGSQAAIAIGQEGKDATASQTSAATQQQSFATAAVETKNQTEQGVSGKWKMISPLQLAQKAFSAEKDMGALLQLAQTALLAEVINTFYFGSIVYSNILLALAIVLPIRHRAVPATVFVFTTLYVPISLTEIFAAYNGHTLINILLNLFVTYAVLYKETGHYLPVKGEPIVQQSIAQIN